MPIDGLHPRAIIRRPGVADADVAIKRTDIENGIEQLVAVYIRDGVAYTATSTKFSETPMVFEWFGHEEVGPAVSASIEFDCYWSRHPYDKVQQITVGEPWVIRVIADGSLVAQQSGGILYELEPPGSGVTACETVRGWISNVIPEDDQGIVCIYLKNGDVYYRNYCRQHDNSLVWEPPVQVVELDTTVNPAVAIGAFCTNDFRVGLLAEINNRIYMTVSNRTWPGLAFPTEILTADIDSLSLSLNATLYHDGYLPDESITANLSELTPMLCLPLLSQPIAASNPDEFTILVEFDRDLYIHNDFTGITVRDAANVLWNILSAQQGGADNILQLNMVDFTAAFGDMRVIYTGSGMLMHQRPEGCLMEVGAFTFTFAPVLVPPEGYTDETITANVLSLPLTVTTLTYIDGFNRSTDTITADLNTLSVAFYHIAVAPP